VPKPYGISLAICKAVYRKAVNHMKIKFYGNEEKVQQAENYLEIMLGDYTPTQQYAATILMHMLLKEDFRQLMEDLREITGFKVNDRNSAKVVAWKKKVKKIGRCEICGSKNNLVAHHIVPWSYSIKGRTDVTNGQCLCRDCHVMMHNDDLWIEYMQKKVKK
jgi:predicted restriction endonuclease